MSLLGQHPKEESFNFRGDPKLKAEFQTATEAEDKSVAPGAVTTLYEPTAWLSPQRARNRWASASPGVPRAIM